MYGNWDGLGTALIVMFTLACVGVATIAFGIVMGIIWLIEHVRFV